MGGRVVVRVAPGLAALAVALAACAAMSAGGAPGDSDALGPTSFAYAVRDTVALHAYAFSPADPSASPRGAIVVFHGGGWNAGAAEWGFPIARRFAQQGMVAISVEYRLSDLAGVTPLEAMADASDAIRWVREEADSLWVDPARVAAFGWSAGGHLAACAAIFDDEAGASSFSCSPDALVLESPALSLADDRWFQRLLRDRAEARDVSPDEHVRPGLPPTLILQGDMDTVTPLAGAVRFRDLMLAAGNVCELQVYHGYGHLFTPAGLPDDGVPQPDPEIVAQALARADEFLAALGFVNVDADSAEAHDRPSN
jgi:acetyl esterase/lipase